MKHFGSIYTPTDFAEMLCAWAIEEKNQSILDIGVGEGAITFASYRKLLELGADTEQAQIQIYGTEVNPEAFSKFRLLANESNNIFPNISLQDFFLAEFPKVDVVIGNPPYVRRSKISNYETIKEKFDDFPDSQISSLTDLYIYFILQACKNLRENGKLAIVTSDSWLNARYGKVLKNYLKENFETGYLVNFDRNIFHADVKALLTLATKKKSPEKKFSTNFVRIKNGLPAPEIYNVLKNNLEHNDVEIRKKEIADLSIDETWGIQFKSPNFYETVLNNSKVTVVKDIVNSKIGLQTLAKNFFVLNSEDVSKLGISKNYVEPLIQSHRYYNNPIIEKENIYHYLFYCDLPKPEIEHSNTLEYILSAETSEVKVRGKDETVIGYQNKERIKKSRRRPWYNLKSKLEKRGRAEILIPRVIGKNFQVYWNQAGFVPGEIFIEVKPKNNYIPTEVYLAVLSSSLFEVCLRIKGHLYGGGAYSIYPGQFKDIPMPDVSKLTSEEKNLLIDAYQIYISNQIEGRNKIDQILFKFLNFDDKFIKRTYENLKDLVTAVETFRKKSE